MMAPRPPQVEESRRARQIGQAIEARLRRDESGGAPPEQPARYSVYRQGAGCVGCDPSPCPICGYLFMGEAIVIQHETRGKRVLSDKGLHYLLHGIVTYYTSYIVHGEHVNVTLDLEELSGYLDL